MRFDLYDMFMVAVASVFGANLFLSPGGVIGSAIGGVAAITVAVVVKRLTA